jgi:S1-C subfamily serine protease
MGDPAQPKAALAPRRSRFGAWVDRWKTPLAAVCGALGAAALVLMLNWRLHPMPRSLTQDDIDSAVARSLQTVPLPSPAAKAYEVIAPAVVRVRGLQDGKDGESERGVGTGVVVLDDGTILTNLHVVSEAKKIKVTFFDGSESDANLIGAQPENDLAILKARTLPDDLEPAMLRGTADLREGEEVVAVGFPFGIGPSVSAGVVSGLKREYRSPEGEKLLTNLIQFDAAANPGSSGGPLVTKEGEVVGIVTAILNPNGQRSFVGIGFAVPIENAASSLGTPPF